MSRRRMLLRLMLKAALVRKDRAFTALLSIAVVATMATVALTVYSDLEGKFSREFRSFGANAIATARNGSLSNDELQQIKSIVGDNSEVVPVGYAVVTTEWQKRVVAAGTDLHAFHQLNPTWSFNVDPRSPAVKLVDSYPWLGARVAGTLISDFVNYQLSYGGKTITVQRGPVFKSGSEDDSRIYLSLEDFQRLTGLQPNTAQLRIDGPPAEIERRIARLSSSLPQIEVKPLRQVTSVQTTVLDKIRSIVLVASGIVVLLIV